MKPGIGVKAQERTAVTVPHAPDLSVVICSLNGEAGVERCLRALSAQSIVSRIQVIVVDDGSADGTSDVARGYGTVVIRHAVNRGLAAARNSGLRAALGPVVAFLDDDCEPDRDWARRLLAGYDDGVVGVGGPIQPDAPRGFMAGFLERHNPLLPLELNLASSEKLLDRFRMYLQRQWAAPPPDGHRDVYSLTGANMSFRREALLGVGGFDERFRFGGEENDLCRRLGLAFPDGRLRYVTGAEVAHHFDASLRDTLRRSRAYGRGSARMYCKWPSMRATFFPWPLLVLLLLILSAVVPVLAAVAVLSPLLLYPQAVRAAVTKRRPACLLDAYVQLMQEFFGNIGFAEGLWLFRNLVPEPADGPVTQPDARSADLPTAPADLPTPPIAAGWSDPPPRPPVLPGWADGLPVAGPLGRRVLAGRAGRLLATGQGRFAAASVTALALIAALVWARGVWAVQLVMLALLLVVPGVLLLRALRVPGRAIVAFPVYVPCASLAVLLGTALGVDLIGPPLGVAQPLRPGPLLAGLEIICLALLALAARAPASTAIGWRSLPPGWCALPLLLPLIAAAGALRLNNGHGNAVAVGALFLVLVVMVAGLLAAPRLRASLLAVAVYACGLTVMWGYSLRGSTFYGFDIADESYYLHQVVLTGIWHPSNSGNAFSAMLSVTAMPAELHFLTGVPTALVFQAVYPMITALFPVAVFYLGRRVLSTRWAFAAAAFVPTQAVFAQELPGIARQEIALVLFTALAAALLDSKLATRVQVPLAIVFTLAMVVSHYTTTYIAITLIGFAFLLQWLASWFRQMPRMSPAVIGAFATAAVGAFIWYGPVTHSASNVSQFVRTAESQGFNLLPNSGGGNLISDYLNGNTSSPMTAGQYQQLVHNEYATTDPFVTPLPDASQPRYALRDASTPAPPVHLAPLVTLLTYGQVVAQQLIYLLAAAGAFILLLRRKVPVTGRQLGLLTLATLMFLIGIRLSGTLATFYNATRALLQAMVFLNIAVFFCLQELAGYRRLLSHRRLLSAAMVTAGAALLALPFIGSSGFGGAVLGGGTATNLANSGNDYQQFYVTAPELSAAGWLGRQVRPGQLVYADRYAQLPLIAETGMSNGLLLDVTPQTLDRYAWVYAGRTNVVDGVARADFGDHTTTYVFPAGFLKANYNLVYTNGSSEVYHG